MFSEKSLLIFFLTLFNKLLQQIFLKTSIIFKIFCFYDKISFSTFLGGSYALSSCYKR